MNRDTVPHELARKGFKIVRTMNALTGEIPEEKIDPKIGGPAWNPGHPDGKTRVVQGSGQVLVTLTLDRLLELTGTKP